jgi:hypothetical protein
MYICPFYVNLEKKFVFFEKKLCKDGMPAVSRRPAELQMPSCRICNSAALSIRICNAVKKRITNPNTQQLPNCKFGRTEMR